MTPPRSGVLRTRAERIAALAGVVDPARLAVPGPVWGERPSRVVSTAADAPGTRPHRAPRRGARSGPLAAAAARLLGVDPATIAARAVRVAAHLRATGRVDAASLSGTLERALGHLVADGLAPSATAYALGVAGALLARETGLLPRDNQYRCAAALLGQRLAELDTGEGKSIAVALAAGVAALAGAPVHVLTANAYLAARDADAFGPYYRALGLTVSAVDERADETARRAAWDVDVAYANARIAGFDALRDGLAAESGAAPLLTRGRCVAIVDEADSILVDEARTPLVIAQAQADPAERARAWRALDLARRLQPGRDAIVEIAERRARLSAAGAAAVEAAVAAEGDGADWHGARHRIEAVEQALVALHALRRDVDYLVADGEVLIVDASTGRAAPGRQWSRMLHALVALKEGVPVPPATRVRAGLTYPRLLARYHHLCGTSGTLHEARAGLRRDYGLAVQRIARDRPSRLSVGPLRLFADRAAQFDAAIARARGLASDGRSVLVATDSVEDSAALAARFAACGVPVTVLDARHDRDEAARIASAGEPARITVSTQVAGRGTDIRLQPATAAAGGLHVLSLQHNRSARIDRQVAGRAGRQGDPGSVEHWLRLSDSPLQPDRLPAPLAVLVRTVARVAVATPGSADSVPTGPGRGAAWSVALLWRACQAWWRHEDAHLRSETLRHDTDWSRRLHFATIAPEHHN